MKLELIYLFLINIIAFFAMGYDKRKAIKHKWRTPEKTLIMLSVLGGSIGMLLGMHIFRHKTKHKLFTVGVPFILILEISIVSVVYFIS